MVEILIIPILLHVELIKKNDTIQLGVIIHDLHDVVEIAVPLVRHDVLLDVDPRIIQAAVVLLPGEGL